MVITEAMLVSMEELQRHAGDMENHVKSMMEEQGRMHGLELDRRRNARDLWNELNKHMANMPAVVTTAADRAEMHSHPDGTTHAHEGGDEPHTHDENGAVVPEGSQGSGEYLPDPAAQAAGMAPPIEVDEDEDMIEEAAAMPDDGVESVEESRMESEDDTDGNAKS